MRRNTIGRLLLVTVLAGLGSASAGCGLVLGPLRASQHDEPSATALPPTPTYFNPDATSEVATQRCRYRAAGQRFTVGVQIQNPSSDQAFDYSVQIDFTMAKDEWADGTAVASRFLNVTLAPGKTRNLLVDAQFPNPNRQFYYGCDVHSATKALHS